MNRQSRSKCTAMAFDPSLTITSLLLVLLFCCRDTDAFQKSDLSHSAPDTPLAKQPQSRGHLLPAEGDLHEGTDNLLILSEHPDCHDDLSRICSKSAQKDNFAILDCVQNDDRIEDHHLSAKCHHLIWSFKRNMTVDSRFERLAKAVCKQVVGKCTQSSQQNAGNGQLLSCLIENSDKIEDEGCKSFLTKMETIIFSDYRLIYKFLDHCSEDMDKFSCGRLDTENKDPHSQGQAIECLEQHTPQLAPGCKKEIFRIAELQSDDFHLDRPLFFACRDDRERFCPRVTSGEGKVYRCLMRHKLEREMSRECRERLFQREMLAVHDYQVSKGLVKACKEDIRTYSCRQETSGRRDIRLAQILLCLENAVSLGKPVEGECRAEMLSHRKSLMENYQLTPDLTAACHEEINLCGKKLEGAGKTLHCLMSKAKSSRRGKNSEHFSDRCRRALDDLIKEANVGEDWRVDPILHSACESVVHTVCSDVLPGEGRVMSCLMDHIDSNHMRGECRETLLLIQYFISRDFQLDAQLYKTCHKEAVHYCHAKKEWHKNEANMDPERGPTVISCLYRYAYPLKENVLSAECRFEIKRVMKQRALSVDLQPEIEDPCLTDLANFCSDDSEELTKKGFEMECLQNNYEKLSEMCKEAVGKYTEDEGEHLELNYPMFKSCEHALKELCSDGLSKDGDEGDLVECLILNKNKPAVKKDIKCKVSVEHYQLLTLKDYRFSFKFKSACKADVIKLCKTVHTKQDVVHCLSTVVFNDTLSQSRNRVSSDCKSQLRVELFQRSENINLDPELSQSCESDRKRLCDGIEPGESKILECLKSNIHKLSKTCHKILFKREKIEMNDNSIDYWLVSACKTAINKYCDSNQMKDVLFCLRDHRNEVGIDQKCRNLVLKRLAEQNHDFRLNPRLKSACERDIPKFCSEVVAASKADEELDGKVISCLKKEYVKSRLSQSCEIEVVNILREVAQNYELDPVLVEACAEDMKDKCADETDVEECLKTKFQNKQIVQEKCKKEIARLVYEGKADIQSDPLLYKICINDIKAFCGDIPSGHGRQLSCLLSVLDADGHSSTSKMGHECKALLSKRVEMFEYAAEVAPAESVAEVVRMMANSPARNYFLMVAFCIVSGIFFGGLFCGRVTKRVAANAKNK